MTPAEGGGGRRTPRGSAGDRGPRALRTPAIFLAALVLGLIGVFVIDSVQNVRKQEQHPAGVIAAADEVDGGSEPAPTQPPATSPSEPNSQEEWRALLPRLEEAARAAPDDATAQRRLAIAFYNLGRLDDARSIYETLLAAGEDALVRNRLGNVLRDQGDLKGAEEAHRRALADDPTLPAPYVNLAELLSRTRRTEEALRVLAEGSALVDPGAKPALDRAASTLRERGP